MSGCAEAYDSIFITRQGREALAHGLARVRAVQRLDVDLHPCIEPVRPQFLHGEYELAAFAAMREVEIAVRKLGGFDDSLIGVKLMQEAFRPSGPLADLLAESGEQAGMLKLFTGAIAVFKNQRATGRSTITIQPRRPRSSCLLTCSCASFSAETPAAFVECTVNRVTLVIRLVRPGAGVIPSQPSRASSLRSAFGPLTAGIGAAVGTAGPGRAMAGQAPPPRDPRCNRRDLRTQGSWLAVPKRLAVARPWARRVVERLVGAAAAVVDPLLRDPRALVLLEAAGKPIDQPAGDGERH